jgi:hypothetical protein
MSFGLISSYINKMLAQKRGGLDLQQDVSALSLKLGEYPLMIFECSTRLNKDENAFFQGN